MKSIEARFRNIKESNPYWSDWVCFYQAIVGKNFSVRAIRQNFNKLVPKDDWEGNNPKQVISFMASASNMAEDYHK